VGPGGIGPGDAAVVQPVAGSRKGLAIACGLQIPVGDPARGGDPYLMALAAVDECVRNLVCVGADPERIAILDNFCWPSCARAENMGALVRAAAGCYDAAKAYRTPFVSGKDSLNNQFRREDGSVIEIPPTLLVTGVGVVEDVERCVTMDAKRSNSELVFVSALNHGESDERSLARFGLSGPGAAFRIDGSPIGVREIPRHGAIVARLVAQCIREGLVLAAHDCSEGGRTVAIAEMLIAAQAEGRVIGAQIDGVVIDDEQPGGFPPFRSEIESHFAEFVGGYLLEVEMKNVRRVVELLGPYGRSDQTMLDTSGELSVSGGAFEPIPVDELREAFLGTLDW
jgi:phosphoribosylformylglycinamidine (FGAM) synthase-like enzyme